MATRYWVLGSGTWDTTTTTNWSTTSGGAGGASAPTSVDDVIFDANSNVGTTAFTVTMGATANCLSFSTGGAGGALDGVMTVSLSATSVLNVYGSFTLPASNLTWTPTVGCILNFLSNTTGNTVTTNGINLGATQVNFNGVGGGWTLGSAIATAQNFTVVSGTFDTGNYNVTVAVFVNNGASTRTVNFGSSTVTVSNSSNSFLFTSTGLTFNAGTSTLVVSSVGQFLGAGLTFYNVSYTSTTITTATITGANTYNNLSFAAKTTAGVSNISITNNLTINGTLTVPAAATAGSFRYLLLGTTYGTPVTLTAAAVSFTDTDFRDIVGDGTATWSGTRLGDVGGNTGITFPASKTVYWNLAGTQNISANGWATTQTGTPATTNFPLAQDTLIFTDTNPASGAQIIVNSSFPFGTIDFSARTLPLTLSGVASIVFTKDVILSSAITNINVGSFYSFGRNITQNFTSAGVVLSQAINQNTIGGTLQLNDAVTMAGQYVLQWGTLSTNYNLTCSNFYSVYTNTRAITFGGNVVSLTGTGTVWNTATTTGLTLSAGTSTISLTNNSATARTFAGGGLAYWNLDIGGSTGISTTTFTGSNTFNTISSTKAVAHTILFTAATTTRLANWTVTGTAGNIVTIGSVTAASHNLVNTAGGNISCDYMSISRSNASPSKIWYAGSNSTNGGNNTGWLFTALPNQIIYGGAGTYKINLKEKIKEDDEEDDEEMIIMALAHQLIEMRVI